MRRGESEERARRWGHRVRRGLPVSLLLLAGCVGWALQPASITTTGATLRALTSCSANTTTNPCTGWFQYWRDGSSTIQETNHVVANANVTNYPFNQTISGLTPSTLYHYEFCGYGDTDISPPGFCTGPLTGSGFSSANAPGTTPDPGDFNATANFRTAGPTTSGTVDLGRVLSTADTANYRIARDAGISVQYSTSPPLTLWVFADTTVPGHIGLIPYGTAAQGSFAPGVVPTALNELPTPPSPPQTGLTAPAPFFPAPAPLLKVNGGSCGTSGSYAADWVMGGAKIPNSSNVLLVYGEVCVESSPLAFTTERLAVGEYNPFTNTFVTIDHPFVASPLNAGLAVEKMLHAPVFANGYLFLYAGDLANNAIYIARVPANQTAWSDPSKYKWWNGADWTKNSSAAVTIIPGAYPLANAVSVADYSTNSSHKYVLVEQTGFRSAGFQTYESTSPRGPWLAGLAAQPPDACVGGTFGCYAVNGHAELSTSTQFVYSWWSVDDRSGEGHIRVGAVDW